MWTEALTSLQKCSAPAHTSYFLHKKKALQWLILSNWPTDRRIEWLMDRSTDRPTDRPPDHLTYLFGMHIPTHLPKHLPTSLSTQLTAWIWVLLDKRRVLQLVKKLPSFYATWQFINEFTKVCHLALTWARSIQNNTHQHGQYFHLYSFPFFVYESTTVHEKFDNFWMM